MTAGTVAIGFDRTTKTGLGVAVLLLALGAWQASTPRYGSYEPARSTPAPVQPQQGQQFRLGQQGSSTPAAGQKPASAGRPGAAPVEPAAAGIPGAPPAEEPAPGVVAPAPTETAGTDDGIPGPPPTQSATIDDGGIPGPPPGQ